MLSAEEQQQQLQIRLCTKESELEIPHNVFSISATSTTAELQELVTNLITEEHDEPFDFAFKIGDVILQDSLASYIKQHDISGESVIEIEYFQKRKTPEAPEDIDVDDWVGGICAFGGKIFGGLYNGEIVRVLPDGTKAVFEAHSKPIKDIALVNKVEHEGASYDMLVSASQDQTLSYYLSNEEKFEKMFVLRGHTETVTCCAVSPSVSYMGSGSWDNMLKVWSTSLNEPCDAEQKNKRKKTSGTQALLRTPLMTLGGHSQVVTGVTWQNDTTPVTVSHDNTLKIWDTIALSCIQTINGVCAFQGIDWSEKAQLFATCSSDKHVRLYDPRGKSGTLVHATLTGHQSWVSSVKWSPGNENELVSGSYDCNVLLWDVRSVKTPLANLAKHEDKVLCLDWSESTVVSGGADKKIKKCSL